MPIQSKNTPSQVRLNPHAKSLFLRHCKNYIFDIDHAASDFFRFLLISKSFLSSSQQFKVYKLKINYFRRTDQLFIVCLANFSNSKYYSTKHLQLSQDELIKMNQLLNVQCVSVRFRPDTFSVMSEACEKLWDEFSGKVSLSLKNVPDSLALPLINKLNKRIIHIDRDAKCLVDLDQMPQLFLDFCLVRQTESLDQLKQIMTRHPIKKLAIQCKQHRFDTEIPQQFFSSFPYCAKLQRLTINYFIGQEDNFIENFASMLRYWGNLKRIHLSFKNVRDGRRKSQHFIALVMKMCDDISEIEKAVPNTTKIKIDGHFQDVISEPFRTTKDSMDRLERHEYFQEAYLKDYNDHGDLCYYIQPNWIRKNLRFNILVEVQLPGMGYRSF